MLTKSLPHDVSVLSRSGIFTGCRARQLRRMDGLSTILDVKRGKVLCRRGAIGRECFFVLEGEVDVQVGDHHQLVGPGVFVGEMALLTPTGRRTATVIAVTNLTVAVFTRAEFAGLMSLLPEVEERIVREAARRSTENADRAEEDQRLL